MFNINWIAYEIPLPEEIRVGWEHFINHSGEEEHAEKNFAYLVKQWWMENVSPMNTVAIDTGYKNPTIVLLNYDGEDVFGVAELVNVSS